nr:MAG TPA: hypothetical protein [Bacteriophage sp.]
MLSLLLERGGNPTPFLLFIATLNKQQIINKNNT